MNKRLFLYFFILSLQLAGCTSFYQYRSSGDVISVNGIQHKAVLYWYGEEGRLWYGKEYAQIDTSLNMRICQVGVKPFVLSDTSRLELQAKNGDVRIKDINDQGVLQEVNPPYRVKTGDYCGLILLDGQVVTTEQLRVTLSPSVAILCQSQRNPDRYPSAKIYQFGSISRFEASRKDRAPPDPCLIQ